MTLQAREKTVLFLQGPPSVFWSEFAKAFEAQGSKTLRVNFTLGDRLFWRKRGGLNYRGTLTSWPHYLKRLIEKHGVTDIVYYADRLPYHREAARLAATMDVQCHAVEWGYLRPDWITLERGGMGRFSHFPNDPARIREIAAKVEPANLMVQYPHTFDQEAFNEVVYNLLNFFGRPFYPLYTADKYYSALVDYLPWLLKFGRKAKALPEGFLEDHDQDFFVVALQLQSDYQIRANSPYRHLREMMRQVVSSFARHAPKSSRLVFKQHPLDNGLERWDKVVKALCREFGMEDRVIFIDEGNLHDMLEHAKGVVVVNSTVGLHSLRALKPTIVLGAAVFDMPGLTHQGRLEDFWLRPQPVDPQLISDLVHAMAGTIQVKGDFFNSEGRKAAIDAMVARITEDRVNEPDAFMTPPPRFSSPKGIVAVADAVSPPEWEGEAAAELGYARAGTSS
ncbi:capsule biosynthesis protein [Allorhizobium undicola]|uniref:capsule biosynthesis protein n=1 Tax=Allorhizobium undicola TaxID=78527 RepID=UPI000483DFE2|nr:capsular biosynthesis protein [Allorhizobium undicola]